MGLYITLRDRDRVFFESMADTLPDVLVIGRGQECQWIVPKEYRLVGRVHARLVREGGRLFIEDAGSRNGTFLMEQAVTKEELRVGLTFSLANSVTLECKGYEAPATQTTEISRTRVMPPMVQDKENSTSALPVTPPSLFSASPAPSKPAAPAPVTAPAPVPKPTPESAPAVPPAPAPVPAVSAAPQSDGGKGQVCFVGWTSTERGKRYGPYALPLVIGSSAKAGLRFQDSKVSRRHAEVFLAPDGSVHIRDLGSAAGTLVDGQPVTGETSVKLTHGARLFIAHLGFIYDDGHGLSGDKPLWGWGSVLVVVLLAALTAVRLLGRTTPEELMGQALPLAVNHQLDRAERVLDRAESLARAPAQQEQVAAVRAKVRTLAAWLTFSDALRNGDWAAGVSASRTLRTDQAPDWDWGNALASPEPQEAARTISLLTNAMTARQILETKALPAAAAARAALDRDLAGLGPGSQRYADRLCGEAREVSRKLNDMLETEVSRLAAGLRNVKSNPAEAWKDPSVLEKVLAGDGVSLNGERAGPAGEYDRYVGTEDMYEYCRSLLGEDRSLRPMSTPFRTELVKFRAFCQSVGALLAIAGNRPESEIGAGLAGEVKAWREALGVRDRIVQTMLKDAQSREPLRALVAAVIALQLADAPDQLSLRTGDGQSLPLKDWAAAKARELRDKLPGGGAL